eukprot:6312409-Prymnesium_polylepis.1
MMKLILPSVCTLISAKSSPWRRRARRGGDILGNPRIYPDYPELPKSKLGSRAPVEASITPLY